MFSYVFINNNGLGTFVSFHRSPFLVRARVCVCFSLNTTYRLSLTVSLPYPFSPSQQHTNKSWKKSIVLHLWEYIFLYVWLYIQYPLWKPLIKLKTPRRSTLGIENAACFSASTIFVSPLRGSGWFRWGIATFFPFPEYKPGRWRYSSHYKRLKHA